MTKARILVVEDDAQLRASIKDILELEKYSVLTAQNGLHGLEVLRSEPDAPPDLIVSDIMMPYMGGIEFFQEVRKEHRWSLIPFIFLTAKTEKSDRHKGLLLGVDDYLSKPFDTDDLLVAVASRLERNRVMKEAQKEITLDAVSDVKKNILTILNHEFRTPLTLVVAYAEMLKDYGSTEMSQEELLAFLKGVNSGADRLRRLVENFIFLVELENGNALKTYSWRKRPIEDIETIFRLAHQQVFNNEKAEPYTCNFHIQSNLPALVADYEFIVMLVRELLDNAVKFSKPTAPIEAGAHAVDGELCIWVEDKGRGIPENEFENIWKTFYQIDRETLEDQGAGSGLAIVKGIVEMHFGRCHLTSEEHKGSRFEVYLPFNPPPEAQS